MSSRLEMTFEGRPIREQLRLILADRHSPEATALFDTLLRYAHRRVEAVKRRAHTAVAESETEEIVGEILLQLISGGLARFRGDTLGELMSYVRTTAERIAWRAIRARWSQREGYEWAIAEDLGERITARPAHPDEVEFVQESPLPEADQRYLIELLQSGSKAELARRSGVSRAAVTQRVQRIQARVEVLCAQEQASHHAWLEQAARRVTADAEDPDLMPLHIPLQ